MPKWASNRRMNGPLAQEPLLSLALPSSSALRPSKSRKLTSLPRAAPTTCPAGLTASTISGSGLFQCEPGCRPTSLPVPTADNTGALVNISASGPIPTSRYCDQAPRACSTRLTSCASAEPGRMPVKSWPKIWFRSRRKASARLASPRACSSITRSSKLAMKVTPLALITCKSQGASSQGRPTSRMASSALATTSAQLAMTGNRPAAIASRTAAAGSGSPSKPLLVSAKGDTSCKWPLCSVTSTGPVPGSHSRPISSARVWSVGSVWDSWA